MVLINNLTQAEIDYATPEFRSEIERTRRNNFLQETDWWAVQDRTMTQAEVDYRQALRDITDQDGFPADITWPTKPE